jgi:isoleucyl-tRNA synthetase
MVLRRMSHSRDIIEQGLAQRMQKSDTEAQVKVRQPLSKLTYGGEKLPEELELIIAEEVNVETVINDAAQNELLAALDKTITPELKQKGMMREVVRNVQTARKAAGLEVDDRIELGLKTTDVELQAVLSNSDLTDVIKHETLAESLVQDDVEGHNTVVTVEGAELTVSLRKV